jgi:hypothetical protein
VSAALQSGRSQPGLGQAGREREATIPAGTPDQKTTRIAVAKTRLGKSRIGMTGSLTASSTSTN